MRSVSILIVEDEAMTAMFMESVLKRKGYSVLKCISSGEEAVSFAIKNKPELVIMDIRLAGKMDGIEAVSKIKSLSPERIHYIFTTGYSDIELKKKAMELEPLSFFIKPINLPELYKVLETLAASEFNNQSKTYDKK